MDFFPPEADAPVAAKDYQALQLFWRKREHSNSRKARVTRSGQAPPLARGHYDE
jgi:hypothetical protein